MRKTYDDYGYSLAELAEQALKEGKKEYANVFTTALIESAEGNPERASHICEKIARFRSMNTTMGIFDISLTELDPSHVCDVNNPDGCK